MQFLCAAVFANFCLCNYQSISYLNNFLISLVSSLLASCFLKMGRKRTIAQFLDNAETNGTPDRFHINEEKVHKSIQDCIKDNYQKMLDISNE